jgi:hypothetical protein
MDNVIEKYPFISFNKIQNFKNARDEFIEYRNSKQLQNITGTVKLHGTHGGVVRFNDGYINVQSKNRILSKTNDNIGFATFIGECDTTINTLFDKIILINKVSPKINVIIFGEWCGKKIQPLVALNQLPQMFVIFAIKIDNNMCNMKHFKSIFDESACIYNIYQFTTYKICIDFENFHDAEILIIKYTNEVEQECPVGKHFGISGIGEGIVWKTDDNYNLCFKTKGELMSHTKPIKLMEHNKILNSNIKETDERVITINNFVNNNVTTRINQGIEYLREFNLEISKLNTNVFRKWIVNDIILEEANNIEELELNPKEYILFNKRLNNHASSMFLDVINYKK